MFFFFLVVTQTTKIGISTEQYRNTHKTIKTNQINKCLYKYQNNKKQMEAQDLI